MEQQQSLAKPSVFKPKGVKTWFKGLRNKKSTILSSTATTTATTTTTTPITVQDVSSPPQQPLENIPSKPPGATNALVSITELEEPETETQDQPADLPAIPSKSTSPYPELANRHAIESPVMPNLLEVKWEVASRALVKKTANITPRTTAATTARASVQVSKDPISTSPPSDSTGVDSPANLSTYILPPQPSPPSKSSTFKATVSPTTTTITTKTTTTITSKTDYSTAYRCSVCEIVHLPKYSGRNPGDICDYRFRTGLKRHAAPARAEETVYSETMSTYYATVGGHPSSSQSSNNSGRMGSGGVKTEKTCGRCLGRLGDGRDKCHCVGVGGAYD